MKIPALFTVLALACGAAFAQTSTGSTAHDDATNRNQAAAPANSIAAKVANSRPAVKTRNALTRAGEATGRVVNRVANASRRTVNKVRGSEQAARRDDSRSMGAPASNTSDSDRSRRMDDAYANWQRKQN